MEVDINDDDARLFVSICFRHNTLVVCIALCVIVTENNSDDDDDQGDDDQDESEDHITV